MRISICDTGSGINPQHAKRIFEPFFTTKDTKGTGLGLWISRGIIQKYEGTTISEHASGHWARHMLFRLHSWAFFYAQPRT